MTNICATTILCVKKDGQTVMIGDGQVTVGQAIIMKDDAKKLRRIASGNVVTGFAGSTADAITLFERLEEKLEQFPTQLTRACVDLAKDWRQDKYLRKLEAMLLVANKEDMLILTGMGDVIDPIGEKKNGVSGIGSGGNYAIAAAQALLDVDGMDAEAIATKAMKIAADMCVFTNHNTIVEKLN